MSNSTLRPINNLILNSWFNYVFTYSGDNHALQGFLDAIELIMETGFAVTAFVALILNLLLEEEVEDEEIPEITADTADETADAEEWARVDKGKAGHADPEKNQRASGSTDIEATKA